MLTTVHGAFRFVLALLESFLAKNAVFLRNFRGPPGVFTNFNEGCRGGFRKSSRGFQNKMQSLGVERVGGGGGGNWGSKTEAIGQGWRNRVTSGGEEMCVCESSGLMEVAEYWHQVRGGGGVLGGGGREGVGLGQCHGRRRGGGGGQKKAGEKGARG